MELKVEKIVRDSFKTKEAMLNFITERNRDPKKTARWMVEVKPTLKWYENYTVCIMEFKRGNVTIAVDCGIAKRNPRDKFNPAIGAQIAINRAYAKL